MNSLEELGQLVALLGLECAATVDQSGSHDRHTSKFLGFVAGTLKKMMGELVVDIEGTPEIQKLPLVMRNSMSHEATATTV